MGNSDELTDKLNAEAPDDTAPDGVATAPAEEDRDDVPQEELDLAGLFEALCSFRMNRCRSRFS